MRKIIAGVFVTLDGVMDAPGNGDTTLPVQRGWSEPCMTEEIGKSCLIMSRSKQPERGVIHANE